MKRWTAFAAALVCCLVALLSLSRDGAPVAIHPTERGQGEADPSAEPVVAGEVAGAALPDGSSRVPLAEASGAETGAAAAEREGELLADGLIRALRESARGKGFHAAAWSLLEAAAPAIAREAQERRAAELETLVRAVRDALEDDRVRGACLLALAMAAPEPWFETEFPEVPTETPELERAGWVAAALRRHTRAGLEIPVGDFPDWSKLETYPVLVDRVASPEELERGLRRMRAPLDPALYENGARGLPESRQEGFTREVVLLCVLGPGAAEDSPEQKELLALLAPRTIEDVFLKSAATYVLVLAARGSDALARRILQVSASDPTGPNIVETLEFLARFGGREDLAVEGLEALFRRESQDDLRLQVQQTIASKVVRDLLTSDDPAVRDAALAMALGGALDASRNAHQRLLLLSCLEDADHAAYLDALSLVIQSDRDEKLLGLLAASLRSLPDEERATASQLFSVLLDKPELGGETKRFVLGQIVLLGGPEARALLTAFLDREPDAALRQHARELLAKLP